MRFIPQDQWSNSPIVVKKQASLTSVDYETTKLVIFFPQKLNISFPNRATVYLFGTRGFRG